MAYSDNEDAIVRGVIDDAKKKGYTAEQIKHAVRSNTFDVPDLVLCAYLPSLEECYK